MNADERECDGVVEARWVVVRKIKRDGILNQRQWGLTRGIVDTRMLLIW
jgi:hypothetical protein